MQSGDRERATGLDFAGDIGVVERALGFERDQAGSRIGLVTVFDRRLQRAQSGGVQFPVLSGIGYQVSDIAIGLIPDI